MSRHQHILPMQTSGTQHLIERTYREGGRYQWVRESLKNSIEAGATRVEFGVDWGAVERAGVYRRVIADNGTGMTPEQLRSFFNTFGAGSKAIGGVHENFGVGSKTSLLPWNHHGVVVISWVDGDGAMIWIRRDPETGQYGLRLFEAEDQDTGQLTLETVVDPYDEWVDVSPPWVRKHGTVVVLLGNTAKQHTILGDPTREEHDLKGVGAYLNRRLWDIPSGVEVTVEEVRSSDARTWPRSAAESRGPEPEKGRVDRRVNRRTVMGARHYVEYPVAQFKKGRLASHGVVPMRDGARVSWYLWEGERPGIQSYGPYLGFVGALYRGELYDVTAHLSVYRSFGVIAAEVRARLWLVVEPREYDEATGRGAYPRTDRNALLIAGPGGAGEPIPLHVWGAEFSDQMPEPIRDALRKARNQETGEINDEAWRAKLAERFGDRWRINRLRVSVERDDEAQDTVSPTQLGTPTSTPKRKPKRKPREREEGEATAAIPGTLVLGAEAGVAPANRVRVGGGIPTYRIVTEEDVEAGMLAAWQPHAPEHPEGVVLINGDHPVIAGQVRYWTSQYPDHLAPDVEQEVLRVYGQLAVAKVAHSERMRGILPSEVVDRDMRSDASLTMSLLGLLAEEAVISSRLGAKYGKRRQPAADVVETAELPAVLVAQA